MALDPSRVVAELRELQELTGDENGAQRVAWTETWETARAWLREKVASTGAVEEIDEAGNQWFTLAGESEQELLLGGHIDSVPNGGWLDGCLNVVAAVEVLRRVAEEGTPPLTVRVVNWADEEGARFGRSLFGSSAAGGSMADQDELRQRRDADGIALPDALAAHGVDLDRAIDARSQLANAAAYLELHIEQGPVLESLDLPLGVVLGTFGVERHLDHVARPGGARRLDADGPAPRRARRRREARARAPADRGGSGGRGGVHVRRRRLQAGHRHVRRRDRGAAPRPAAPRRREARAAARAGARRERAVRARGEHRRRMAAALGHRADPVRRAADRARGGVDPRGLGHVATGFPQARSTTPPRSRAPESRR